MAFVICPQCGLENGEFNPVCRGCAAPLPPGSNGESNPPSSVPADAEPSAPLEDLLVGRHIDQFRVVDLLGRGGMGEVYRAYDENLERPVALKVIRPDKSGSDELRQRFQREARAASGLDHPAIVKIYDVLEHEEGDFIVMELVEGQTFGELFARGPLDLVRLVSLAREIAEGLAAAHGRGIAHRDLKAENIMVTRAGQAKILDFGLAKRFALSETESSGEVSLTVEGGVVGTFRAMSPEQAQGFPVDHRSDLFSFGTLVYEAATGHSPFRRQGLADTLAQLCLHRQTPARELNPRVPESLSELIDQMLEKDPKMRPQSAEDVASILAEVLAELTR